ncbi:MAG: hypothetical protein ACREF1_04180, partial [Acetobacteraceae bacterium]
MPFLTVPRGRISYEDTGTGFPVRLFAPGFLSARIERWRSNPARPDVAQDWGDDTMHPAVISNDIPRLAPRAERLSPWPGPQHRDAAMQKALAFFLKHRPG